MSVHSSTGRRVQWIHWILLCCLLCLPLLQMGCPGVEPKAEVKGLVFPKTFEFGTAIAGFQGDMGCPTLSADKCNDTKSDWYQWVTSDFIKGKGGIFHSGDGIAQGPGQWELYAGDYTLAKEKLNAKAQRLSLEWSRVFPTSTEGVTGHEELKKIANMEAIATYRKMLKKLIELGIRPMVTLHHYSLPTWIHDGVGCHRDAAACKNKGWADPERLIPEIVKYSGFVAKELGDLVDVWMTMNEPVSAVVLPAYLFQTEFRVNPPARSLAFEDARKAYIGMIEAHSKMYDAVKANDKVDADKDGKATWIGIAYSAAPVYPKDPKRELDVKAAKNISYLVNDLFLDAIILGKFDKNLDGNQVDRPDLARCDFLGVNYYLKIEIRGDNEPTLPQLSKLMTADLNNLLEGKAFIVDYPQGVYDILKHVSKYKLPIWISENGHEMRKKDGKVDDSGQSQFMVRHLFWIHQAIKDGVDVRGYLYWSLVDNYEWNHGMKLRFGLFTWDDKDPKKARIPRAGVTTFQSIAKSGMLTVEMLKKYLTDDEKKRISELLQSTDTP